MSQLCTTGAVALVRLAAQPSRTRWRTTHMADADDRLRAVLRAEPPPAVLELDDADRTALADLLDEARRRQTKSLQDAFEASLKHVPFPVRGIVKKVLLG